MPLAVVTRSATTPSCCDAKRSPVRANPVCTSSSTKTTPLALAHCWMAGRKPSAGAMKPPSPWMGSMMTAATLVEPTCFSICVMACSAASAPESPSRNGYDAGTR